MSHTASDHIAECNQCEYRNAIQGNLICNIQLVHEGAKKDCNLCKCRATHKANLAGHIESINEGAKYECSQCDYRATGKDILYTT